MRGRLNSKGSTLVELVIGMSVLAMVGSGFILLYNALITGSITAKQKSVASTLATDQMEYLKSLPYNTLAVAGGSIFTQNPLPATATKQVNNYTYTIKTSINYVDDAFDGCTTYSSNEQRSRYCRNYPPPSGSPSIDLNPQDYKVVHVSVFSRANVKLAEVDTQIAGRVAETTSNTGSVFVTVVDGSGSPVPDTTVSLQNSSLNPLVALSDTTDISGTAVFYGVPPDTSGFDYTVNAQKSGYSSLSTLQPNGTLQPTYPSLNVFSQQPSNVTLAISPMSARSVTYEAQTTGGTILDNMKLYVKGGYKKYTDPSDTTYYFDNLSGGDSRPTTDSNGTGDLTNLPPGGYFFCGDVGATSCTRNGVTYYLASVVPYGGTNLFSPFTVPSYDADAQTFSWQGNNYMQKVRLLFTTSSTMPRIVTMSPSEASLSSGQAQNFSFNIQGVNLPCSSLASSCATIVTILQGALSRQASCTGSSAGTQLDCTVDLSSLALGQSNVKVEANGQALTVPGSPLRGGINVIP